MKDAQHQPGGAGVKRASKSEQASVKSSQRRVRRHESRVNLGLAFERWRELKDKCEMKSDAEVALYLLETMKRSTSRSASPEACDKKIKFSQCELEALIKQEVCTAVKKRESKLQGFIDRIQQLEREVNYESSIRKLEARIKTITKRAEAALTHITKTMEKSPVPAPVNEDINRIKSEDETMETESQTTKESLDKNTELLQTIETTKKALKKMHADKAALTAATADLNEEQTPPLLSVSGSPDCKRLTQFLKKEMEKENIDAEFSEDRVKGENVAPAVDCKGLKRSDSKEDKLSYRPPPAAPFPSVLCAEAASFNTPQRLEVQLALIRDPPSLAVLWTVEKEDPRAPPMCSYSILMTMEEVKDSGVFPDWTEIGAREAIPLPMMALIKKYKPGHKVCVTVVGKDKFGRYGPYSRVVTAAIPDLLEDDHEAKGATT